MGAQADRPGRNWSSLLLLRALQRAFCLGVRKARAAASSSWRYEPGLVVEKHGTGAAQTMRGGRSLEPVGRSGIVSFQLPARSLDMLMRRDGSEEHRRSECGKGLLRSENHQRA